MQAPSSQVLLRIWEEQAGSHPIRRALALLDSASSEVEGVRWAQAPIGAREHGLLALYEDLFGPELNAVTDCPRCGESLESTFAAREIGLGSGTFPSEREPMRLRVQEFDIEYRLPTSEDLLGIVEDPDPPEDAPLRLLRSCVLAARRGGRATALEDLPSEVLSRVTAEMAERDPGADIRIGLTCPACAHGWTADFDIASYLLDELDDWAQRTLAEVHILARAYGWSEREILDMSPIRRSHYIEMVQA